MHRSSRNSLTITKAKSGLVSAPTTPSLLPLVHPDFANEYTFDVPRKLKGQGEEKKGGKSGGRLPAHKYKKKMQAQTAHLTPKKQAKGSVPVATKAEPEELGELESSSPTESALLTREVEEHTVSLKKGDDMVAPNTKKSQESANVKKTKKELKGQLQVTNEGAIDGNTRLKLIKLFNSGDIHRLEGVIQTGKEASVYLASRHNEQEELEEFAVKIYKTVLTEFKDRTDYIVGEWRFRYQLNHPSQRKIIKLWAEKELRNLKRLNKENIPAPVPRVCKGHILVMSFIGKTRPAPQLGKYCSQNTKGNHMDLYKQVVLIMRRIYQRASLVHADLSEYNLLVWKGQVHVIDVAQAVEHDHPSAMLFLVSLTQIADHVSLTPRRSAIA